MNVFAFIDTRESNVDWEWILAMGGSCLTRC
jgi:hypothetical protein